MKRSTGCILAAGLICLAVAFDTGCWGRKFFRAPGQTIETSVKVDSLLKENMVLQRRVYNLERMLANQQDYSRGVNAQLSIDLEEMKDQINALYQSVAEGNPFTPPPPRDERRIDQPTRIQDARSGDPLPVPGESTSVGGEPADSTATGNVPPSGGDVPEPEEFHRQIYLDFSRMEYQLAVEESDIFLDHYNDHPLSEDVRFIRGECFMELGKYFDALKEFSAILQQFPGGRKKPATLLRMAISYDSIGDDDLAAGVARRLVREHPGSEEAATARERFGELVDE